MTAEIEKIFSLARDHKAHIIDVREVDEWMEGHLKLATHVPLSQLKKGISLPFSKSTPLYIHCKSGKRAKDAEAILIKEYPQAVALSHGYDELKQAEIFFHYD